MKQEFKSPSDPALRTLWLIRNLTMLPKGNLVSWEEIVKKVNKLSSEVYDQISMEKE